jgi:hypothetical protein
MKTLIPIMIRHLIILFLFTASQVGVHAQPDEELLRISINGKIGFINLQGKVIIEPRFKEVGNFVDGLAPARADGGYGYINKKGEFVIPDVYDYVKDFSDGYGIVYFDKKQHYIDPSGKIRFEGNYKRIAPFKNGMARVQTYNGWVGMIGKNGSLIIDTIYEDIHEESDSVILAYYPLLDTTVSYETNVYDLNGKKILTLPSGFHNIDDYHYGFAYAEKGDGSNPTEDPVRGWLDKRGNFFPDKCANWPRPYFPLIPETEKERFEQYKDIGNGRYVITRKDRTQAIITSSGIVILPFQNKLVYPLDSQRYVVLREPYPQKRKGIPNKAVPNPNPDSNVFSVYDLSTGKETGFRFSKYIASEFNGGVIAVHNGILGCYDFSGELIYQLPADYSDQPTYSYPYEIYYQGSGHYAQFGKTTASSGSDLKYSVKNKLWNYADSVFLIAQPDTSLFAIDSFGEFDTSGRLKILLVNNSSTPYNAFGYYKRLQPLMQAKDKDGQWKFIEYFRSASGCGNGIHPIQIEPHSHVLFMTWGYSGIFKTKLRIAIAGGSWAHPIYSNEFDGSINPGQFYIEERDEDDKLDP